MANLGPNDVWLRLNYFNVSFELSSIGCNRELKAAGHVSRGAWYELEVSDSPKGDRWRQGHARGPHLIPHCGENLSSENSGWTHTTQQVKGFVDASSSMQPSIFRFLSSTIVAVHLIAAQEDGLPVALSDPNGDFPDDQIAHFIRLCVRGVRR